ncbi:hypothetical protein [Desertivirga brevis]|uniref:hypothetical protein n=1 Tax=Desertivirga brevis TaxID=2810310 RepID=UPI001A95AA5F|nr:hypothetical protein [Pedobacter sp. SYSU D00873]
MISCFNLHHIQKEISPFTRFYLKFFISFFLVLTVAGESASSQKKSSSQGGEWITFKQTAGAFSVKMPHQPEYMEKEMDNPGGKPGEYKMKIYYASDDNNKASYLVRYNDFPQGIFLADRNKVFELFQKDLAAKGEIVYGPEAVKHNGMDGVEFRMMLDNKYYTICRVFTRGSRIYFLMRQNQVEKIRLTVPDEFFESFSLLPYQETKLLSYQPEGEMLKMQVSETPNFLRNQVADHSSFLKHDYNVIFNNPSSGGAYNFESYTIKEYLKIKDLDSLYSLMLKGMRGSSDTVSKTKSITVNGLSGREFETSIEGSDLRTKTRIWVDGNKFFFLSSNTTEEELRGTVNQKIFNSFVSTKKSSPLMYSSSKIATILKDLSSSDTSVVEDAKGALNYYNLQKGELPAIHRAVLERTYPDDTKSDGIRVRMIETMAALRDRSSSLVLKDLFSKAEGLDHIRAAALVALPEVDTVAGYDNYLQLLTTNPLHNLGNDRWMIFRPLSDSVQFTADHLDQLLPLFRFPDYRTELLTKISYLLYAEDQKYNAAIVPKFKAISSYANEDLNSYLAEVKAGTDTLGYNRKIYSYLHLLQEIKGQSLADAFTAKLIKENGQGSMIPEALVTRIVNKLKVDEKLTGKFLDSIGTRYSIMEAFHKVGQLSRVPQKFKSQREFARLCLYNYLNDDDEPTENIELLGEISVKDSVYYAYKVRYPEDEGKSYLGLAGGHKSGSQELNFKDSFSFFDWLEIDEDWKKQAVKLLEDIKLTQN